MDNRTGAAIGLHHNEEGLKMDFTKLQNQFDGMGAAPEYKPLPAGEYEATLVSGSFTESRQGTPGYTLTFEICDGKQVGRRLSDTLWLTPAALPFTKRDLSKIGIDSFDKMKRPVPPGIVCRLRVALRRDDDGTQYNRVRSWEPVRLEAPSTVLQNTDDGILEPIPHQATITASIDTQVLESELINPDEYEPDEQEGGDDEILF